VILVLSHQDDAGPGNLLPWLAAAGLDAVVRAVPEEGLPDTAESWDAVVVLGSRESTVDPAVPWAEPERALVRGCIDAGTPVLGICFGAQQLALVLGGTVSRMPAPRFGWTTVTGNGPVGGEWFSWHEDHVAVPAGATELARSPDCVQAFRYGPHLGVQFHPEITGPQIAGWIDQAAGVERLAESAGGVAALRRRTTEVLPAAQTAAAALYAGFFLP
jgi:GMP synthase (glutamine-hydrolysing)